MRHWTIGWAALALVLAGTGRVRADNIVVNGGFETGTFSGWTVTGTFIEIGSNKNVGGYGPNSGTNFVGLGTVGSLGKLAQTLNTVAGDTYQLSFSVASDGATPSEFRVDWNGSTILDRVNLDKAGYTQLTFKLPATSNQTPLVFLGRNDPGYISLDDVKVSTVSTSGAGGPPDAPEPPSLTLLGLGALGLGSYTTLRRRRAMRRALA